MGQAESYHARCADRVVQHAAAQTVDEVVLGALEAVERLRIDVEEAVASITMQLRRARTLVQALEDALPGRGQRA
jgi:hypothetical protein